MARTVKFRGIQRDIGLFDIVGAGIYTTAGGAAAEVMNIRGVLSTDIVVAMIHTQTSSVTLTKAVPGKNLVTFTFSDDPSTTCKINYIIMRDRAQTGAYRRKY